MSRISLNVDATCGLAVKVGDRVEAGDRIGNAPETGQPVETPVSGVVASVDFQSDDHSFLVAIDADQSG
jgi:Na+-translocating ferredoxin:NAD+ oxidoreductase RnfC subunit